MKHVCKYCDQSFVKGNSLGGHMRAHNMIMKPVAKHQENDEIEVGFDCNGQSEYGLRENPKKSWRVFYQKTSRVIKQQSVCEQCGRGFKSDKALFGHMRLHSVSGKGKLKAAQCEYIIPSPVRKKRSQRRYELNPNCSSSNLNESSCVSNNDDDDDDDDDDEKELREVAECMLMLSRGGFYSVPECSEIDSVHLQSKLGILDTQMSNLDEIDVCSDDYGHDYDENIRVSSEMGFKRVNSDDFSSGNVLLGNRGSEFCSSDSGFMSPDLKKVGFDLSLKDDDGSDIDCDDHYHMSEVSEMGLKRVNSDDTKSGYVLLWNEVAALGNSDSEFMSTDDHNMVNVDVSLKNDEFQKSNLVHQLDFKLYDSEILDQSTTAETDNVGYKEINADACVSLTESEFLSKHSTDVEMHDHIEKDPEISCKICGRVFQSRQALRGHGLHCPVSRRRSSKKATPDTAESKQNKNTDTTDNKSAVVAREVSEKAEASYTLREWKNHVCSICCKVYQSGQALGGHMRAHFVSTEKEELILSQEHNGINEVRESHHPAVELKQCCYENGQEKERPLRLDLVSH